MSEDNVEYLINEGFLDRFTTGYRNAKGVMRNAANALKGLSPDKRTITINRFRISQKRLDNILHKNKIDLKNVPAGQFKFDDLDESRPHVSLELIKELKDLISDLAKTLKINERDVIDFLYRDHRKVYNYLTKIKNYANPASILTSNTPILSNTTSPRNTNNTSNNTSSGSGAAVTSAPTAPASASGSIAPSTGSVPPSNNSGSATPTNPLIPIPNTSGSANSITSPAKPKAPAKKPTKSVPSALFDWEIEYQDKIGKKYTVNIQSDTEANAKNKFNKQLKGNTILSIKNIGQAKQQNKQQKSTNTIPESVSISRYKEFFL